VHRGASRISRFHADTDTDADTDADTDTDADADADADSEWLHKLPSHANLYVDSSCRRRSRARRLTNE